uniref:Uncharacterized protein n=1 Tax=Lepisosteus oculatus TaxID=7918 RepID=W5M7Z8_LEPOC
MHHLQPLGNHGFHTPWLDSCLGDTLLPDKPWHKVYEKLGAALAKEVESHLRQNPQSQLPLGLLGGHFLEDYLGGFLHQTTQMVSVKVILKTPINLENSRRNELIAFLCKLSTTRLKWASLQCSLSLCESEKASLEYESLRQLDALCERAVESSCCPRRPDGDYSGVSQEMMHFIKDTYHMVTSEMEQMLALEEKKQKEAPKFNSIESPSAWASMARRRPHSVESEDRKQQLCYTSLTAEPGEIPAPPLHCAESQVLGRSVAAVLASDPGRMGTVCKRLKGQLLPESLRGAIWIGQLLKPEAFSDADTFWTFEKTLREKFGRMVERRVAELKLRSATRSPISGLIENAVVEKYERTPSMQAFATNEQMISESSKVLNILYVHSGIYEPYLIHWLFPLQMAFRQTDSKAEHLYELSMYLHCLIQKFPCWPEIFAMAENVMRHVEENDPELFAHLQLCSSRNMVLDSKTNMRDSSMLLIDLWSPLKEENHSVFVYFSQDFLVELIAQEREKAQ